MRSPAGYLRLPPWSPQRGTGTPASVQLPGATSHIRKITCNATLNAIMHPSPPEELAAAGKRLVERVSNRRRRDLATIASRLSPDQQRQAVEALRAFGGAAGEVGGADLFGWDVTLPVGGPSEGQEA